MKIKVSSEINELINNIRQSSSRFNLVDFIDEISSFDLEQQEFALKRVLRQFNLREYFSVDQEFFQFIEKLINQNNAKSIAIIHPDIGLFSRLVENKFKPEILHIYSTNKEAVSSNEKITSSAQVIQGNPLDELSKSGATYDLILGFPPFGLRENKGNEELPFREHVQFLLVEAAKALNENGKCMFTASPAAITSQIIHQINSVCDSVKSSLTSVITLPNGFFQNTGLAPVLVTLEKYKSDQVFIARYQEKQSNDQVINGFIKHKNNRNVADGKWFNIQNVRSIVNLEASERLDLISKRSGLNEFRLDDIFEISRCNAKGKYSEPEPNILYMHNAATASKKRAIRNLDPGVKGNTATNYYRLKLKSEKIDFDYIQFYLQESPYVQTALQEHAKGAAIQVLNLTSIANVRVFLPSKDVQEKSISAQQKIQKLKAQLDGISDGLWGRENQTLEKIKELEKEFPGKKFETWLDDIHYPLSSILWNVHISDTPEKKVSRLLYFFEALSEYLSVIQLSAYQQHPSLCSDIIDEVFETLKNSHLSLDKASFGTWNTIFELLAKKTRSMINGDSDQKEWIKTVFKTDNAKLIDRLVDKQFVTVFKDVVRIRNQYKGHSGEVNEQTWIDAEKQLNLHLESVQAAIEYICDHFALVKAVDSKKSRGVWLNKCEVIHGKHHEFVRAEYENNSGIDSDCLSLLNVDTNETIPLLPLVKVEPGPETKVPACYFYNRIESEGSARFVSYHFGSDAETKTFDEDVSQIVQKDVC